MYLGFWEIDDYLTFVCNTHDPSTGAATDADSAPSYRIYEDETGTAIVTGTMALLDSGNTDGFYSERIQLTAVSGFETGKCYHIYISATVSSVAGTMSHTFQVMDVQTLSEVADALHDEVVEGTLTMRQILRLLLAVLTGKSSGGGTSTIIFRDNADSKARITATVDSGGNRTAVTLDGT